MRDLPQRSVGGVPVAAREEVVWLSRGLRDGSGPRVSSPPCKKRDLPKEVPLSLVLCDALCLLCSAGNIALLQAARADVHLLGTAILEHGDALNVWLELAVHSAVGVAD